MLAFGGREGKILIFDQRTRKDYCEIKTPPFHSIQPVYKKSSTAPTIRGLAFLDEYAFVTVDSTTE